MITMGLGLANSDEATGFSTSVQAGVGTVNCHRAGSQSEVTFVENAFRLLCAKICR